MSDDQTTREPAREWLNALADCAQSLREGFPKQALKCADKAHQIEQAYPQWIAKKREIW